MITPVALNRSAVGACGDGLWPRLRMFDFERAVV
jgi:hypothetical protein